ncbi:MAG: hypothetical protein NTX86_03725 [Candidatus Dependentiae bacterium]|nr:hypothetical protein [Candidatus Dependentiae bacterium]
MNRHKTIAYYGVIIALALSTSGCLHLPPYRLKRRKVFIPLTTPVCPPENPSKEHSISIWIHGTRLIPRPILFNYFYSKPGLHHASVLNQNCYLLRELADTITNTDPQRFPFDNFYIFGWSGELSERTRKEAALELYQQLKELTVSYYEKYKVKPNIRLITHSHGGNVALNLTQVKNHLDKEFTIKELILLACPVQKKTMDYIHDPLFEKIYALYSSLDLWQVLAPQFLYRTEVHIKNKKVIRSKMPLFSERRFPSNPKLAQIKIKINGNAIFHSKFTSSKFMQLLPSILDEVTTWQKEEPQYPYDKPDTKRLLSISTKQR